MARARSPLVVQPPLADPIPEADRLGDYPHPRHTPVLLGHRAAEQELARAFEGGRPHHGWMLVGSAGIGKATLAWHAARYLLAEPADRRTTAPGLGLGGGGDDDGGDIGPLAVDPECNAARQVSALSHPGLLLIRRPWDQKVKRHLTQISVDEVRRLRSFLGLSAGGGTRRVVLVDSLDEMNVNAANALLKGLEEPPPGVVFLLVVSEPGRVLPTIRSRCRTLTLGALGRDEAMRAARTAAANAGPPVTLPGDAELGAIADHAEGSVRRLLSLAAGDGIKVEARVRRLFERLPDLDWGEVHGFADDLTGADKAERFDLACDLMLDRLARLTRARAAADGSAPEAKLARYAIADRNIAAAAGLWADIVTERATLDAFNLDKRTFLISVVERLSRLGR